MEASSPTGSSLGGGRLRRVDRTPCERPFAAALHPDRQVLYATNWVDGGAMTAFRVDPETGDLVRLDRTPIGTAPTLPPDYGGHNQCADVRVHPSGRWVDGSNRGHDSVATFRVGERTGRLDPVGHRSTGGSFPQDLAIDPSGRYLFAGNRHSDELVAFEVDRRDGGLSPVGDRYPVPGPSRLVFATPG